MEIDIVQLMKELINIQGVEVHLQEYPYDNIQSFDRGFRQKIYEGYHYSNIIKYLANNCRENKVYFITDQFEINYVVLKPPSVSEEAADRFIIIGPYVLGNHDAMIPDIIERNQMPLYYIAELKEFYCEIPVMTEGNALEGTIALMTRYIFGENTGFSIERIGIDFSTSANPLNYRFELDNTLSVTAIEERYHYEDRMLASIERGDYNRLIMDLNTIRKYRIQPRTADSVRDIKNLLIVLNTLCRKTVQKAEIHPAHIDSVSAYFSKKIEAGNNSSSVIEVGNEMLRKYCLLVRNHSLRGYSQTVQKVINYIDFNMTEPLSLKYLAQMALVSPNHLSMQFKKETGKNLTDYINEKRIQSSLFLLASTNLPIQSIAEKVGIIDENYFSRLFKQIQHKTAREYRNIIKSTV